MQQTKQTMINVVTYDWSNNGFGGSIDLIFKSDI